MKEATCKRRASTRRGMGRERPGQKKVKPPEHSRGRSQEGKLSSNSRIPGCDRWGYRPPGGFALHRKVEE
jgi:hypothetical protein